MTDGDNPTTNPPNNTTKNGRLEPKLEVDSTEAEPCLSQDEVKPKKLPFYEKHLSNIQERTGLSRKWVLIGLGLVVLLVVSLLVNLGLLIGWPCIPHMFRYNICRGPECLRAASQVCLMKKILFQFTKSVVIKILFVIFLKLDVQR